MTERLSSLALPRGRSRLRGDLVERWHTIGDVNTLARHSAFDLDQRLDNYGRSPGDLH